MVKYRYLVKIIKMLANFHKKAVIRHKLKVTGTFMAIRMFYVWKSKLRLFGSAPGDLSFKFRSDIKNTMAF